MDCRVVVEAAVPVYDVETADEAVRIAISKTGEMLNPDLNYVEINTGTRMSPSGEELDPAFVAADEALVALELRMDVFNVDRGEHASRVARKEIGKRLRNIPLKVLSVTEIDTEESGRGEEAPAEEAPTEEEGPESDPDGSDFPEGFESRDEPGSRDGAGSHDGLGPHDESGSRDDGPSPQY